MSDLPIAAMLPDGERLHLHHGPIDLIIGAEGPDRTQAYEAATDRFQTVLTGLVRELEGLQSEYTGQRFEDPIAGRMARAVAPFARDGFVTAMAAVAGAVADEVLETMVKGRDLQKVYVNNGGDIAFFLAEGQRITAATSAGTIEVAHDEAPRGVATSGWRGRSNSLGIADAVTVLAETAAAADTAATLIANHVDLPGHPAIERRPACEVETHTELGDRLVTMDVGPLSPEDVALALDTGVTYAEHCQSRGLIVGARLLLQGETRIV